MWTPHVLPLVLAESLLAESSGVSVSLALTLGGALVVLAVAWGETRSKVAGHEKDLAENSAADAEARKVMRVEMEAKIDTMRRDMEARHLESERERRELRAQVHKLEVDRAGSEAQIKSILDELREQKATAKEVQAMVSELLRLERRKDAA